MSCLHGNHEDNCDNCDEEIRQWTMGYESQLKELCGLKEERDALKKENAAFKAAQESIASDAIECVAHPVETAAPVYFIRMAEPRDAHDSEWHEATKNAFDVTPDAWKRVLYRQPTAIAQPADMECWYWEHQLTSGKVIDSGFSRTKVDPTDNALWGAHPEGKVSTVVQKLTSMLIAQPVRRNLHEASKDAAVDTLLKMGFTYFGKEEWKPLVVQPVEPAERAKLQWGQFVGCDLPTPAAHCQRDQPFFSAQPTAELNFCSRCGKRLGGIDDVHTCTAPAHLNLSKQTVEKLHKFLDAAAGDGVISDGADAADLYIEIFPEQYAESAK